VNQTSLRSHMQTHNRGMPYECSHAGCLYASKTAEALKYHKVVAHRAQSTPCAVCGKMMKTAKAMRHHTRAMHSDRQKPVATIPCPVCARLFVGKNDLAKHVIRHENARLFECALCQSRYLNIPNQFLIQLFALVL
jgi:hypothetical protein